MEDQTSSPARSKRGPKTDAGRAAALANLKPFGESRQPTRRKTTAGESIREWINRMVGSTEKQIRAVARKANASMAEKIAARRLLSAITEGADFDRIMDRTAGKPVQESKIEVDTTAQVIVQQHALAIDDSESRTAAILALIEKRARDIGVN